MQILVFSTDNKNSAVYNLLFIYSIDNNKPRISSFATKKTHFLFLLICAFVCVSFACLEKAKGCSFPSYKHPRTVLQTTPYLLLLSVSNQISPKTFQLPHQQKWCFQERFPSCSPDKKDGSDQTKLFQQRGGSGQKGNVKAYRENTHNTSI